VLGLEHPGPHGRGVGVLGVGIPAAEDQFVELGDRDEVLDERVAVSVRLPSRMWPSWVSDPIGAANPLRAASTPA
jgi:hypothetical protein